jgi:hypothetical protein
MAQEGESVLPGAPDLQVVCAAHIPEVCSVAGWNIQIWNILYKPEVQETIPSSVCNISEDTSQLEQAT